MSLIQKKVTEMNEKKFDEVLAAIKIQHKYAKEALSKDNKFSEVATVMKDLKVKLYSLHSKDPEKTKIKNAMIIKLIEQIAYCFLKDNKPKEALKVLTELEVVQDIVKEKNLKAAMYLGRTHLMLQNNIKAFEYFTKSYEIADNNTKEDIKPVLDKIKLIIKEQSGNNNDFSVDDFLKVEIGQTNSLLTQTDVEMTPIFAQSLNTDITSESDSTMEAFEGKSIKEPIFGTVEICTVKAYTGILTEYTQKSRNQLPKYTLDKTTTEYPNKNMFHMICECIGHSEFGSTTTKRQAKEIAAKKMIKYLQEVGKLRLTTEME